MFLFSPVLDLGDTYYLYFSPSGRYIASCLDKCVVIWETASLSQVGKIQLQDSWDVIFSPGDEQRVICKNTGGSYMVYDLQSSTLISEYQPPVFQNTSNTVFDPTGTYLIDGTWEGNICVRNALTAKPEVVYPVKFPEHTMICNIACFPGSNYVAFHLQFKDSHPNYTPEPSHIEIWRWPFEKNTPIALPYTWRKISSMRFAHLQPELAISANYQQEVCIINCNTKKKKTICKTPPLMPEAVDWLINDKIIAFTTKENVQLIEYPSCRMLSSFPMQRPKTIHFSPDGRSVIIGTLSGGKLYTINQ